MTWMLAPGVRARPQRSPLRSGTPKTGGWGRIRTCVGQGPTVLQTVAFDRSATQPKTNYLGGFYFFRREPTTARKGAYTTNLWSVSFVVQDRAARRPASRAGRVPKPYRGSFEPVASTWRAAPRTPS